MILNLGNGIFDDHSKWIWNCKLFRKLSNVKSYCCFENIGDSDVGDVVMLVTLWWWLIWDVGATNLVAKSLCWRLFTLCWWFSQYIKLVTNILNRSPTHLVSNIRHRHRCNQNIDIKYRISWFRSVNATNKNSKANFATTISRIFYYDSKGISTALS